MSHAMPKMPGNLFAEVRRIQAEAPSMDEAIKQVQELQNRMTEVRAKEYLDGVLEMLLMEQDARERE